MAYLDIHALPPLAPSAPRAAAPLDLTMLRVLHLARRDPLRSLYPYSPRARVAHRLFGGRPPARLACPRLEALRRYAVLLRHHGVAPVAEAMQLGAAGVSPAAIAAIHAIIFPDRPPPSWWQDRGRAWLTLGASGIGRVGAAWLDSGLAGVVAALALPLLRRLGATSAAFTATICRLVFGHGFAAPAIREVDLNPVIACPRGAVEHDAPILGN